jgi:hypothetical protein
MKNIVQLLVLLSFGTYAQTIRPFIGTSGYVHSSFENSGFGEFKLGSEYKVFYYLKPEIEISIMLGSVEEETNRKRNGHNYVCIFYKSFSSKLQFFTQIYARE